jgi:replication fork clamp-binding protein CrfC
MCPKDNLLCTSCIDSSGRDHSHQLISLRRFHSFLQAYSNQAQAYTAKAKEVSLYLIQAIQTLRKEIGQQIDGLENLSVCQLSLGVDGDISTELELRVKLQDLAARGIWSRLHEKVHKEEEIGPEIEEEIEQYWQPTSNIMKELLNTAKLSC